MAYQFKENSHKNLVKKKKLKQGFFHINALLVFSMFLIGACVSPTDSPEQETPEPEIPNPIPEAVEGREGEWVWVPVDGMKCRDGSDTGIAVRLSSDSEQENLVVFLRGGNACFETQSCGLTAFNYGPASFTADTGSQAGIFNETNSENPFRDWHKVFVPYCTGDVHSGALSASSPFLPLVTTQEGRDASIPVAHYTAGLFAGYTNMEIVTRVVSSYFRDRGVEQVVLTGSSAGGFGVHINYDQMAQAFGAIRVTGIVDAAPLLDDARIMADCGMQFLELLWGIRLPGDYNVYVSSTDYTQHRLLGIYKYLAKKYPDRQFGLLSHTEDPTIRLFYALIGLTGGGVAQRASSLGIPGIITCGDSTSVLGTVRTAGVDIAIVGLLPGVRASTFTDGLTALQNSFTVTNMTNNWRVYYDGNDMDASGAQGHTFLVDNNVFYNTRSSDDTSISSWINNLLTNSAQHRTD